MPHEFEALPTHFAPCYLATEGGDLEYALFHGPKEPSYEQEKLERLHAKFQDFDEVTLTYLYRAFSKDSELLYVGISNQWEARLEHHMKFSPWRKLADTMLFELYPTRDIAKAVEYAAITEESPIYNVDRTTRLYPRKVRIKGFESPCRIRPLAQFSLRPEVIPALTW